MKTIELLTINLIIFTLIGCRATSYLPAKFGTEEADIQAFLKENELHKKAKKTDSGIYYIIEEEGEGEYPTDSEEPAIMDMNSMNLNDDNADYAQIFYRPQSTMYFKGFHEAVGLMKPGGKAKFIIPAALLYGDNSSDINPPEPPMIFDVDWLTPEEVAEGDAELIRKREAEARAQAEKEDAEIQAYLKENKLDKKAKRTDSGIYYIMEKEGEGEHPTSNEPIAVHYHGRLLDGTVFDSSVERDEPLKFQLKYVIKGWQEAIGMMKPGGKGKFIIPSGLAYGKYGASKNTPLIYDIELLIEEAAARQEAETAIRKQVEKDEALIKEHLAKLDIDQTAKRTDSGIYYTINKEGEGENPSISSTVKVATHHHGSLADIATSDYSVQRGQPTQLPFSQMKGLEEGILLLKPGGNGIFYVPSYLLYGANPSPGGKISPNTIVVFEIELFEVK